MVITPIGGLITPFITTHEPPSRNLPETRASSMVRSMIMSARP